jgi:hypothetical protein
MLTKLTSWFEKNINDPSTRNYTYIDFPRHFTWHVDAKCWSTRRAKYNKIIAHVCARRNILFVHATTVRNRILTLTEREDDTRS